LRALPRCPAVSLKGFVAGIGGGCEFSQRLLLIPAAFAKIAAVRTGTFLVYLFSAALSGSVMAADAQERLAMPQFPTGWVQAFAREGEQEIVEYVPEGQTHDKFQDKITIETYQHLNLPLDALQRRAVAQAHDGCDGVVEGKFQSGVNNGYASAFWTLGCRHAKKTTFGETRYTKAIQAQDTLYVITRLWRTKAYDKGEPSIAPRDIQDAVAFLSSSVVCRDGSAQRPCPTAPASPAR
jgi:hypothetical protein